MSAMASQITSLTIVYSIVYSGAGQRKHQSSASLAFVRGIHRWPVNSPHKGPVTRKMFPFHDVTLWFLGCIPEWLHFKKLISPWTKLPPFRRRYFHIHIREWKILCFDWNFTEVCSLGSNWQCTSIGLDNGLAPNRRQVIIWTNAGLIYWPIYAAPGGDELIRGAKCVKD